MKSDTWTIQQVFQGTQQYKVPFYQRAYVWTLKKQWELLWKDIQDKAEERLAGITPAPHFLGAIVVEPQELVWMGGVPTAHIIDGQQRLTTLQYVLRGLRLAVRDLDIRNVDTHLGSVLENPNPDTMAVPEVEVFKVWPTFIDQKPFTTTMTAKSLTELKQRYPDHFTQAGNFRKIGIVHPAALEAVWYFAEWAKAWIQRSGGKAAEALAMAVLQDLKVVLIRLEKGDDAQVIFETLNGRGAELNATDLIRNHLFMRVDAASESQEDLYNTKWKQFEAPRWKVGERRGRITKPRLEWLIYSTIRAETGQEGDLSRLYVDFKDYAKALSATQQLDRLDTYGHHYIQLIDGQGDLPIARFGRRLRAYDTTTTHPLALKISTADIDTGEKTAMFNAIVSYIVRRAVCGLTPKNYNNWFMSVLRQLSKGDLSHAALVNLLSASTSEVARWPDDAEFTNAMVNGPIYSHLVSSRLTSVGCRSFLTELEAVLRSPKSEEPTIPDLSSDLDIDHVMPQSWFEYWPLRDGTSATSNEAYAAQLAELNGTPLDDHQAAIRQRVKAIPTLGNLTLLNLSVNREAKNKAFPTKKSLLIEHTNLSLNVKLVGLGEWNEDTIAERGKALAAAALKIYPR